MSYTQEEKKIIQDMVAEFSLIESKETRREKIGWYSLASSIKDKEKVTQIMKDIKAI